MQPLPTIYLGGAINGCSDAECKDWRDEVTRRWESLGGRVLNPMRRDYRGSEEQAIHDIVELDKIDINKSDVLLVSYDKPSVGTSMEVLYAWERGKTVVLVLSADAGVLSPWLRYHSHRFFHRSYEQALTWIVATA